MYLDKIDLFMFDADDTLRESVSGKYPYPAGVSDWRLLPDVVDRLAEITWYRKGIGGVGYGIVSNQPGVALGHIGEESVVQLLHDMVLAAFGFEPTVELVKYCPHDRSGSCGCRKPHPKLLNELIAYWKADPLRSVYVGDRPTDETAAVNAGCHFIHRAQFFGEGED